ncbi:MAG: PfkB family carbohydrate kinase [Acidimicrobiia bacterium]
MRPRIAIIGDFCLDAYWNLETEAAEISKETGLPVQRVSSQTYGLGGAGNVAANLVALGVTGVRAVGYHGQDPFGREMVRLLADAGVDLTGIVDLGPDWNTPTYAKPYAGRLEQQRLDFGTVSEQPAGASDIFLERVSSTADWADLVVIVQQFEGPLTDHRLVSALNQVVLEHPNIPFIVDARSSSASYRGVILKVNIAEATNLVAGTSARGPTPSGVEEIALHIMAQTGQAVFVTRGEQGIIAVDASGTYYALGIEILAETDPVGAGDTVTAALAAVLASGGDMQTAVDIANLAASITVRKVGATGTATQEELAAAAGHPDFIYAPELAADPTRARWAPNRDIELISTPPPHPPFTHAIFDHDGTLSTLREGWEDIMEPMMIRAILGESYGNVDPETVKEVRGSVADFIDRTTGVQTLKQMVGLVGLVKRWGFVSASATLDEHGYKAIYNEMLLDVVGQRRSKLASGQLAVEDFHIKGAISVLARLQEHGVELHLASGTDVGDVYDEAHALGFGAFFEDRIHGAVGNVKIEAKRAVLERLVRDEHLDGTRLVTFGDGPVEMRVTRAVGGLAVGVCSDERRRFGFNPDKRSRLIRGGAMLLIPDFSDVDGLMEVLDSPVPVQSAFASADIGEAS